MSEAPGDSNPPEKFVKLLSKGKRPFEITNADIQRMKDAAEAAEREENLAGLSDAIKRARDAEAAAREEEHYGKKELEQIKKIGYENFTSLNDRISRLPENDSPRPPLPPGFEPVDPRDFGLPPFQPKKNELEIKPNFEKEPYSDLLKKEQPPLDVAQKTGNPTPKKP